MDLVPVVAALGLMGLVGLLMSALILYAMRASRPTIAVRRCRRAARRG